MRNYFQILPSATTSKTRRKCILIPGVEGLAASMSPVAESLEAHSICLQINSRVREPDISKTAEVIYKVKTISIYLCEVSNLINNT